MKSFPRMVGRYCATSLMGGCLLGAAVGCTSVQSTMVTRDEANQFWERHDCLNGIPITLKVPTHLKVYVFHKHYLDLVSGNKVVSATLDVVLKDFAHEFMYTEKIFFVDFKRPPAGSSNLRVDMTQEQYIDELQHDITDRTLSDASSLLAAFTGSTGLKPKTASATENAKRRKEIRSLVAVGIFEIESPDFEMKLRNFIDCHVNKSHDAWVVPPGVRSIQRQGLSGNKAVPYPPEPLCAEMGNCVDMQPFHETMPTWETTTGAVHPAMQ